MARNYDIDEDAFYADPENYQFSEDEIRSLNARALEDYELRVPMTPAEKRALRKWVASGHSVSESPGSKYICDLGMDFERMDAIRNTPVYVQKKYETLSRKLFLLWEFLATEGLCQEAREYLEDHKDEEMPMDFSFILE